jgi:uncharacterized membrane protein
MQGSVAMIISDDIHKSQLFGLLAKLRHTRLLTPGQGSVVKPYQRVVYYFIFFSWCGFIFETLLFPILYRHIKVWQGPLHGPWLVIYGFAGLAMLLVLGNLKQRKFPVGRLNLTPVVISLAMFCLVCVVEYLGHWFLDYFFNFVLWDYSAEPFNLHGRICLYNSLGFAILGTLVLYNIVPIFERLLNSLTSRQNLAIFTLLFAGFSLDFIVSFGLVLLGKY